MECRTREASERLTGASRCPWCGEEHPDVKTLALHMVECGRRLKRPQLPPAKSGTVLGTAGCSPVAPKYNVSVLAWPAAPTASSFFCRGCGYAFATKAGLRKHASLGCSSPRPIQLSAAAVDLRVGVPVGPAARRPSGGAETIRPPAAPTTGLGPPATRVLGSMGIPEGHPPGQSPRHQPGQSTGYPPGHPSGHPPGHSLGRPSGHSSGHPPGPPGHPPGHSLGHPLGHPPGHPAKPHAPVVPLSSPVHRASALALQPNGDGRFGCVTCGKSFRTANYLAVHLRVHTGERPFACACGKAFVRRCNLVAHLVSHKRERPHTCPRPACRQSFQFRKQLELHVAQCSRAARPQTEVADNVETQAFSPGPKAAGPATGTWSAPGLLRAAPAAPGSQGESWLRSPQHQLPLHPDLTMLDDWKSGELEIVRLDVPEFIDIDTFAALHSVRHPTTPQSNTAPTFCG